MQEEPRNEEVENVDTPEAQVEADRKMIEEAEAAVLNKKLAAVAGSYFRALASISNEEIYELAYTDAGQNSPRLLEVVNDAFTEMLAAGGDLPRGHFDHYKKLVSDFNNTLVFNIDSKLDQNRDNLIAKATGKEEAKDRISHRDIIVALEGPTV